MTADHVSLGFAQDLKRWGFPQAFVTTWVNKQGIFLVGGEAYWDGWLNNGLVAAPAIGQVEGWVLNLVKQLYVSSEMDIELWADGRAVYRISERLGQHKFRHTKLIIEVITAPRERALHDLCRQVCERDER